TEVVRFRSEFFRDTVLRDAPRPVRGCWPVGRGRDGRGLPGAGCTFGPRGGAQGAAGGRILGSRASEAFRGGSALGILPQSSDFFARSVDRLDDQGGFAPPAPGFSEGREESGEDGSGVIDAQSLLAHRPHLATT